MKRVECIGSRLMDCGPFCSAMILDGFHQKIGLLVAPNRMRFGTHFLHDCFAVAYNSLFQQRGSSAIGSNDCSWRKQTDGTRHRVLPTRGIPRIQTPPGLQV